MADRDSLHSPNTDTRVLVGGRSPGVLYFSKLPGRPLLDLHRRAQQFITATCNAHTVSAHRPVNKALPSDGRVISVTTDARLP